MDAEHPPAATGQKSTPLHRQRVTASDPSYAARWSISETASWVRLDDGAAAVMEMTGGRPLRLSLTAAAVWDVLIGDRSPTDDLADVPGDIALDDVVAEVATRFGEDRASVGAGVRDFLSLLTAEGILTRR